MSGTRSTFGRFLDGNLCAFAALLLVALLCYYRLLAGGFQIDDWGWLVNARTKGVLGNDHAASRAFWRPLVSIFFWGLWKFFGPNPVAFRLFSVLLTTLTAFGMRGIWLRLRPSDHVGNWDGTALGALFIVWPTHPETVAWIAGMTDGLGFALATLGLWAYITYRQNSKPGYFLVSGLLFFAGLLSKEATVLFPLIGFAMTSSLIPWKRTEAKAATFNLIALLSITIAYVLIRSHFIGHLFGGYANTRKGSGGSQFGPHLIINLSHAYLPFDKYLSAWRGPEVTIQLAYCLFILAAVLVARSRARTLPINARTKSTLRLALALWLAIGIYAVFYFQIELGYFFFQELASSSSLAWFAMVVAACLMSYLVFRGGRARKWFAWVKNGLEWLDTERRPWALPLAFTIATLMICWSGQLYPYELLLLLAGYLWTIYATRPLAQLPIDAAGKARQRYLQIAVICFIASAVTLLPALVARLPANFESLFRWVYGASVFSLMAWIGLMSIFFERQRERAISVACLLLLCLWQLWPNLESWRQSGLSSRTSALIARLLPARRIYVLAAPADIGGAGLFESGLPNVAAVLDGDSKVKIEPLFKVLTFNVGDRIEAKRLGGANYQVIIAPGNASFRREPYLVTYDPRELLPYTVGAGVVTPSDAQPLNTVRFVGRLGAERLAGNGALVHIKDFRPGEDRVIVIDETGASRVDSK